MNPWIKKVSNVQIGEVVVDRVGLKDVESAVLILKYLFGTNTYCCIPVI